MSVTSAVRKAADAMKEGRSWAIWTTFGEPTVHDQQQQATTLAFTELRADRDRYGEALEQIRDADPVDMALDPGRPARIAGAALSTSQASGEPS